MPTVEPPTTERDPATPLRVAIAAPADIARMLEERLAVDAPGRIAAYQFRAADTGLFPGPDACDVIVAAIDPREGTPDGVAASVRDRVSTAVVPVIAIARSRLALPAALAAIEAGAGDLLSLADAGVGGALALAVARAAASAGRLDAERRRGRETADALIRARKECSDVRAAAITDWVTGLFNKRFFSDRLDEEENKAYRTGQVVSLVMIDLDHFKSVNDTYGHDAGDRVLRETATIIRAHVRNYDIPCRYGGEEFAVILPATRADQAVHVAERIRLDVKGRAFDGLPAEARVTCSAGVADLPSARVSTKEDLVRATDRALYRAKNDGRDRTCVAGGDLAAAAFGATVSVPGRGGEIDLASADPTELSREVLERVERLRTSIRSLASELTRTCERAVESLVRLLEEAGDVRVFSCADKIASYAERIARAMELGADQVDRIRRAGLLQELGMLPLATTVLHDGALDEREKALVRQHPALSVRIADEIGYLREELPIILHHHERYDGSGYPRGLRGDRIPIGSRVLSVAMAYEAMTSRRPYRLALTPEQAIEEIERLSGKWYDPKVVGGFRVAFAAG